jgi:hypothetical protein
VALGMLGNKRELVEITPLCLSVPLTVTTCGNCSVYVKEPNVFGPGAIVLQAIVALLLGDFSHNLNQD